MLKTFTIENYKSIKHMSLRLGRINVLIGENGAGKSNIIEAIALAGAAQAQKLDHEFLTSRGIRAVAPHLMCSAFTAEESNDIRLTAVGDNKISTRFSLKNDRKPYSAWRASISTDSTKSQNVAFDMKLKMDKIFQDVASEERLTLLSALKEILQQADAAFKSGQNDKTLEFSESRFEGVANLLQSVFPNAEDSLSSFVVYSPENSALRNFESENQIEPLGIRGEGMYKLLNVMEHSDDRSRIDQVRAGLHTFGWFEDYSILEESALRLEVRDRFLPPEVVLDQRSVNEGFLYIVFYLALFCSDLTPKFFAIDNVDASLNPKLCRTMIERLVTMAKQNDKQVILTTHNPALLDGLNLNDDDQRLFIVQRDRLGRTNAIRRKKPTDQVTQRKLSELFMAGLIGGLPKGF